MDEVQDQELVAEFVSESVQGLRGIEQDLLTLENHGSSDKELVNRIFRAVHTIKGTGSYLGFSNLVSVSHLAETLLDEIRSGTREATADVTDAVLDAVDSLIQMLESPDHGTEFECTPVLSKLNSVLESSGESPASHKSEAPLQNEVQPSGSQAETPQPDDGLLSEFISESIQGLADIEQDLLLLESDGGSDKELVNRIFRAVHTMKGCGAFLQLNSLVEVAHRAETLLDRIRTGTQEATAEVTDAILAAMDRLASMLKEPNHGRSSQCDEVLAKLDIALGESKTLQSETESNRNEIMPQIEACWSGLHSVYEMQVDLAQLHSAIDIKEGVVEGLSSVGRILKASIPVEAIDQQTSGKCVIYFETPLEVDLLSEHFKIPLGSISKLELRRKGKAKPAKPNAGGESDKAATKPQSTTSNTPQSNTITPPKPAAPVPVPKPTPQAVAAVSANPTSNAAAPAKAAAPTPVEAHKSEPSADQTMRVPVRILQELLDWTGTMVMARNQLMNEYDFKQSTAFRTLSQAITGVHETVIETRMQTTGSLFERYRRVVRDLSRQLKKEVAFHIEGGDLELDRTILESFADPLTHLVRNCLDHALEPPADRVAAGKNRQGNVYLRSYVQSGEIILEVEDDGRGINAEVVCQKAVAKGVITQAVADEMSTEQKIMLIFAPGFSTKDQATDVSGRGVGMDVVKNNIEKVGGTIDVRTKLGMGSTISARLPLAKALVSSSLTAALIIEMRGETFAIPETAVSEIIRCDERSLSCIHQVDGRQVFQLRDKLVALVDLPQALEMQTSKPSAGNSVTDSASTAENPNPSTKVANDNRCLVVLQYRNHLFGAIVDNVVGIQEIIVRSTPLLLSNCTVYSGHTVLGNGNVALILDVNGIVKKLSLEFNDNPTGDAKRLRSSDQKQASGSNNKHTQKMLLFNYAASEYFAIPLELVAIIERIQLSEIKTVGQKEFCQLKQETISVMRLADFLPISPLESGRKDCCLIRPAAIPYPIGIITGPDISVIDVEESFESRIDDQRGIVGTFMHDGHLVMLLDLFVVFEKHAPDKIKYQEIPTGHARILVAEDSLFFRKLVAQYMRHEDWEVEIVNDGVEAWERLQQDPNRFNLIISDINMPRMDGFELATRIRADKRFEALPLVALTTLADDSSRERGLKVGFDRYVIKIDKSQVRSTVAECLKIRRIK